MMAKPALKAGEVIARILAMTTNTDLFFITTPFYHPTHMKVPQAHCPVLPQGEPTGISIQKECQTATPNLVYRRLIGYLYVQVNTF
jgi:hypothetical protein